MPIVPQIAALAPLPPLPAGSAPEPTPGFDAITALIRAVLAVPRVAIHLPEGASPAPWPETGAVLEVPLAPDAAAPGSLRVADRPGRRFEPRDRALLEGFARLVLEQAELIARATRDGLTGARTRRAFTEDLDRALAARNRVPGVLVLFDLDHFKAVNDSRGHAAGDAVLRATARAVQRELRQVDSFGRVGGEEFAVLLQGVTEPEGLVIAERLRAAIAAASVPDHPGLRVTASFGLAAVDAVTPSAAALMAGADRALYAAKAAGRNRVVVGRADSPCLN